MQRYLVLVVMAPAIPGSGERTDRLIGVFRHSSSDAAQAMATQTPGAYVLPLKVPKERLPWKV